MQKPSERIKVETTISLNRFDTYENLDRKVNDFLSSHQVISCTPIKIGDNIVYSIVYLDEQFEREQAEQHAKKSSENLDKYKTPAWGTSEIKKSEECQCGTNGGMFTYCIACGKRKPSPSSEPVKECEHPKVLSVEELNSIIFRTTGFYNLLLSTAIHEALKDKNKN